MKEETIKDFVELFTQTGMIQEAQKERVEHWMIRLYEVAFAAGRLDMIQEINKTSKC